MNPTVVNELLQTSTKLKQFVVTDRFPDEPTVFNASDTTDPAKKIIVKTMSFPFGADQELPQLQTYVQLSRECNICRLLDYELVGYPSTPHVITVMENCGTDLFYFITKYRDKLNLNLILSIALDLLNQIICLQTHNALHGDIRIENVLIDDTGKATLVDFDKLPVIQKQADGTFRVSDLISTEYKRKIRTTMGDIVNFYSTDEPTIEIIMHILSLHRKVIVLRVRMDEYSYLSNIPPGIYDERRKSSILTFPNQESVNIIDLYSWCYVILILLYFFKRKIKVFNEFVYRALVVIIMNIILPNGDMPNGNINDVFDIPINADYIRKVGLGITVLLRYPVPNESCTNYKVRVFLDLIQKCESVENLLEQFQRALSDEAFESKQAKFDKDHEDYKRMQIQKKLAEKEEESGGARRRRTPKKSKKASKCKRTKRGTRRMRYKKNISRKCI